MGSYRTLLSGTEIQKKNAGVMVSKWRNGLGRYIIRIQSRWLERDLGKPRAI
jgi:hypothetical protein